MGTPRIIAIVGCTATGKGAVARALAREHGAEILSIDSMKIYRGMDVGTAKPSTADRTEIRHHLIDIVEPWESFSGADFVVRADEAAAEIHARGRPIVAVGGSVMYFKFFYEGVFAGPAADSSLRAEIRERAESIGAEALHEELRAVDPDAAGRIHRNDIRRIERALEVYRLTGQPISRLQQQWDVGGARRPDWNWTLIGLRREREEANRRINERVRRMVAEGLVEEARRIWSDPHGVSRQARQAVGYAELFDHFEGGCALDEAIERVKINSRRLAKQQRSWLKRQPHVRWLDLTDSDTAESVLARLRPLLDQATG